MPLSSWRTALPWPVAVIDFEASSLDQDGYPIEVGVAFWPAPDEPILGWSALIQPAGEWTRRGHWSPASAKVHGIRGSDLLTQGHEPMRVAGALNEAFGPGGVAWCNGGPYDAHWTDALFKAGGIEPTSALSDWNQLAILVGPVVRDCVLARLARTPKPHRARADAERLLLALRHGVGVEGGPAQDLAERMPALAVFAVPGK